MIIEEQHLLMQDLCARLPFNTMVRWQDEDYNMISIDFGRVTLVKPFWSITAGSPLITEVKPYLRPMSSMTDEEKNELKEYLGAEDVDCIGFGYSEGGTLEDYISSIPYSICVGVVNWLNAHHFDYRGLIPMGLALEAHEGMYNN